ncbi:MAG: hypothetical protein L0Y79_10360 [Chlorobi bacterium]|nr:hypothetical protein [Chlorobiota bacterium]MCI0717122.1 hypothetical protein [Chlorobiota bacterium]
MILKEKSLRKPLIAIIFFFVIYCLFLSWSFLFQNVDDAYISYRYGKNLMNGEGLVYNKGEYVEGYTNFLWTIVTAPFTKFESVDVSYFSLTLGLLFSVVNIILLTKITRLFNDRFQDFSKYFVLLPPLFFALDDTIAFWAIGGMEFPLFVLFILGIVYNYFKINNAPKNLTYLVFFFIMCTLTRPEGNMIFIITLFHMLIFRKRINDFKKVFLISIASYFIFCLIYYGFKYIYYGHVLPNTFYAKGVTDISMNFILGAKYVVFCVGMRIYLLLFILFIPFKTALKKFKLSYLLLFSVVYILSLIAVGGDWMYANRFFVPVIPVLYILSAMGILSLLMRIKDYLIAVKKLNELRLRKAAIVFTAILSAVLFTVTFFNLEYMKLIIEEDNARYEWQWSMFGKWLKINVPPETVIAVGPAGKIPYYSELYTIDMWGLNNDYIGRTDSKRLQAGHKKFDFEYVLSKNPEFIIGYAGFTDKDMPPRYQKFNAPEDEYKCYDIVFRLKEEFRKK